MQKRDLLHTVNQRYRNRLRECRLKALVAKQEELAEMTGINRTTINALENNRLFLSSQYALIIAEALNCSLDDLYERTHQEDVNYQPETTGMLSHENSD